MLLMHLLAFSSLLSGALRWIILCKQLHQYSHLTTIFHFGLKVDLQHSPHFLLASAAFCLISIFPFCFTFLFVSYAVRNICNWAVNIQLYHLLLWVRIACSLVPRPLPLKVSLKCILVGSSSQLHLKYFSQVFE